MTDAERILHLLLITQEVLTRQQIARRLRWELYRVCIALDGRGPDSGIELVRHEY